MRWIVLVAVLVASSGCGWSSEAEKWRRTAEDHQSQLATANNALDQTRKELQEQTEKWQNQSQKLNAAMIDASSKLDPFEIRKIYLDNRDLAAVADQLEAKIASAIPADGDLVLTDAQLRFDVTGYQGRSVIRAYLDYDTAPILVSELAATEPVLALRYNIASEFYGEILTANRAHASESVTSLFPVNDRANEEMAAKLADSEFRGAGARSIRVTKMPSPPNFSLT